MSLDDVLDARAPMLSPLGDDAHGYLITSLPETSITQLEVAGLRTTVRQRYIRYHADLTIGLDAWLATLSANARSGLKRKAKRLTQACGGVLDIRRYRTPDEIVAFHPLASAVSATTYQERACSTPGCPAIRRSCARSPSATAFAPGC